MANSFAPKLSFGKKTLLTSAALLAIAVPVVIGVAVPLPGRAQSPAGVPRGQAPDPALTFEVASVKAMPPRTVPSGSVRFGCNGGPGTSDPGHFTCTATPVDALVIQAFDLKPYQFTRSSSGMLTFAQAGSQDLPAGIDIAAKVPGGTTKEQLRVMLQNLLIKRFKLSYHWDKKERDSYDLVIAKGGLKIKEDPPETSPVEEDPSIPLARTSKGAIDSNGCPVFAIHGEMAATVFIRPRLCAQAGGASIGQLVEFLTSFGGLGAPITDATGLKGKYSFGFAFARDVPPPPGWEPSKIVNRNGVEFGSNATVFAALQEQLGLKLVKKKDSIDIFVIDHVEKVPTEN